MGAWVPRLHGGPASRRRRGNPDPPGAGGRPHRPAARRGGGVQAARRALMAKPRELRRRIKSVQSTRKITKTMELVATSKLKRAQDRVVAARPYAAALAEVIGDLYAPELAERFPLLRQPGGKSRRVALVVITANRGLCGAINAKLIREKRRRNEQLESEGAGGDLPPIAKKGISDVLGAAADRGCGPGHEADGGTEANRVPRHHHRPPAEDVHSGAAGTDHAAAVGDRRWGVSPERIGQGDESKASPETAC